MFYKTLLIIIAELEQIVTKHEIGVIKMEVIRNEGPKDKFLEKVR